MVVVLERQFGERTVPARKRTVRTVQGELERLLDSIAELGEINDCALAKVGALAALSRSRKYRDLVARGAIAAKRLGQPRLHDTLQFCLNSQLA